MAERNPWRQPGSTVNNDLYHFTSSSPMTNIYRRVMDAANLPCSERIPALLGLMNSVETDAERVAVLCRIVTELASDLKRCQRAIDAHEATLSHHGLDV